MMNIGARIGADVPFCVMEAGAALATGTGTTLEALPSFEAYAVLVKPKFGISTKDAYAAIDEKMASAGAGFARPDSLALADALKRRAPRSAVIGNMGNVLELYAVSEHPEIAGIKEKMKNETNAFAVLMSGSGPTVFALYETESDARRARDMMRSAGFESYDTKTKL